MRRAAIEYWDAMASSSDAVTRDAILRGFTSERAFTQAGEEDAAHLALPYIDRTDRVLDVGCGIGRLTIAVAPHCKEVVGLDVSAAMLRKARQRAEGLRNARFARLPASLRFPLRSASFDYACFYHVSEHMNREDAFTILTEIRRCLKPNGRALVEFALLGHADNQQEFRKWARLGDATGVRSRFYTEQEVALLLDMVGLHPQIRLYVPGEFVAIVTRRHNTVLGSMPLVSPRGDYS